MSDLIPVPRALHPWCWICLRPNSTEVCCVCERRVCDGDTDVYGDDENFVICDRCHAQGRTRADQSARPGDRSDEIVAAVCHHYGVDLQTLRMKSRAERNLRPRQVAMYLLRLWTDETLGQIGDRFDRAHPAVSNGVQLIRLLRTNHSRVRESLEAIETKLGLTPDHLPSKAIRGRS